MGGSRLAHPLPLLLMEQRALQKQFQDVIFSLKMP